MCLTRKPASTLQLFGVVLLVSVVLNFAWEMAQAYLYASMGDWTTSTWRCFRASIADGVITLGIAAAGVFVFRRRLWFMRLGALETLFVLLLGASVAIAIEHLALANGRWAYAPAMPIVPHIGVGIVPLAQMMIVPLSVFLVVRRVVAR